MKTSKSIFAILFVLLTAQVASAYYCPSTGRWLSRDPVGEPGFQVLMAAAQAPIAATSSRWISRDSTSVSVGNKPPTEDAATLFLRALGIIKSKPVQTNPSDADQNTVYLYIFVGNDPIFAVDGFGLFPNACLQPLPMPCNSSVRDSYGNEEYPGFGVNLKCFCKCAGDSQWSKQVRGCLACAHSHGVGVTEAHAVCYANATAMYGAPPVSTLTSCFFKCGGSVLPPGYTIPPYAGF